MQVVKGLEPIGTGIYASRGAGVVIVDEEEFDAYDGSREFLDERAVAMSVRHLFHHVFGAGHACNLVFILERPVCVRRNDDE